MIFRTFDSDIDKWTAKIGIFGKSFHDLGVAINNAFKSAIDNIDNLDGNVGFWESLKNNLFNQNGKDFIKNALGEIVSKENIDSYIAELDLSSAKEKLKGIFSWEESGNSWEKYFEGLGEGEKYIKDLIKSTDDLSKLEGQDLVDACNDAREAVIAHNEQFQNMSFKAKAGQVALKGLAIAGNMLATWAIAKGIELAAKAIDELAHSAEHCKERVDELMSSYQSALDTANANAEKIGELADRYGELSKGVNNLGENVSLSTDEFQEYNDIVNQIAEMSPTLVQGYTNEGDTILTLKGNVDELKQSYEDARTAAYNMLIASDNANDIIKNWNNLHDTDFFAKLFDFGASDVGGDISVSDAIKQLEALMNMSAETYREIQRITGSSGTHAEIMALSDIEKDIGYGSFIYKALGIDGTVSDEDFANAKKEAKALIQTYNAEIESSLNEAESLANAYLMTNDDYAKLDEQSKSVASIIVNSLNEDIVSSFSNGKDVGAYVQNILDVIKDNTDVQNALIGLFNLDTTDMSVDNAKVIIDQYINTIAKALEEDPLELKVRLGFDGIDDTSKRLQNSLRQITDDHGIADRDEYTTLINYTKDFTAEQTELWLKATQGANGAADAIKRYEQELAKSTDSTDSAPLLSISETIDQLNTQLKPAFDSLKSAYQDIFTDDGFTLENVDLSMLDSIKSAIDDLNSIEGANISIDYSSFEDLSRVLTDSSSTAEDVHNAINTLATDIVNGLNPSLAQCSGENYELVQSLLESVGIMNSEEVMISSLGYSYEEYIAAKEEAALAGFDLADATESEINAFVQEAIESGTCGEALALLQLKKLLVNSTTINTAADVQQIMNLASAASMGADVLTQLANAKSILSTVENGGTVSLASYEKALSDVENAKQKILDFEPVKVDFSGVNNGKSTASKAGKEAGDAYVDAFEEELAELDRLKEQGKITEKEYLDQLRVLYQRYYRNIDKYAKEFADNQAKYLQGMKSLYESALSGIIGIIDDQIDSYNEQKDAAVDALEEQKETAVDALEAERDARIEVIETQQKQLEEQIKLIDAQADAKQKAVDSINEEIDAMKDANAERERQINLQKAQYELERMQNQRTILQYSAEKGMHYATDDSGLRDARQEVEDARLEIETANKEKQISLIEKEIDLLEEQKDAINDQIDALDEEIDSINEYYDEMIENTEKMFDDMIKNTEKYWDSLIKGMEDYKSRWEELAEMEETAKLISTLEQLGISTEDVLNMSGEAFEKFKNDYIGILADIYSGNDSMTNALADSLGTTTDRLGSYIESTQSYIDSLSGAASQIQPVSDAIGDTADNVDRLGSSASAADESVSSISDDMSRMNTNSSGLSDSISGISGALNDMPDAAKFDAVADSFSNLGIAIQGVADALGVGAEGTVGGLAGALQQISSMSLDGGNAEGTGKSGQGKDGGIISQFNALKQAVEDVTAAVTGGGDSGGGENSKGGSGQESGGGAGSLIGAVEEFKSAVDTALGGGEDAEGGKSGSRDSGTGAIPQFSQLKTAVDDVTSSIGNGEDESGDGEDNLISSIITLGEKTDEELGNSGEDGIIGRFEEFEGVIEEADLHVHGISDGLDEIDGKEVECTIKVNIETNGSIPHFAQGTVVPDSMNLSSTEYRAEYGAAHVTGTANVKGNWGVREAGRSLVGELGQEVWIHSGNGTFETVGDRGAEFIDVKKGDIILNHLQTKELLSKGSIAGRGRSFANGSGSNHIESSIRDLQPGDSLYDDIMKFQAYFDSLDNAMDALAVPVQEIQKDMKTAVQQISNINNVNNNRAQNVNVGDIHITCPGVTSQEVMREVGKAMNQQFSGFALAALQESKKR